MARSSSSKVIRRGKDALGGGPSKFISIQPDSVVEMAPLVGMDDLISVELHGFWDVNPGVLLVCLAPDPCPSCELGNVPGFKAYLPVANKDGEAKIFSFGIGLARDFNTLEETIGSIRGKRLKIKRQGAGLKTRYTPMNTGLTTKVDGIELPDIEEAIGPYTYDEHVARLQRAGLWGESGAVPTDEEDDLPWDDDGDDGFGEIE